MRNDRDVMVNFEPLKHEKDNFSVSGTRGSEKSRTYDFLVTSADALPLSTNYNFHSYLNVAASLSSHSVGSG